MTNTNTIHPTFKELAKPFPKAAYKNVNIGRGFTTIDAYHIVERLTEVFGLCGLGWGLRDMDFEVHGNCCVARGVFWYLTDENVVGEVVAVGDAMVIKQNVAEAYKKAQTNLISKAASYLGVGLSVYQGKGIDDPYLDRAAADPSDKGVEHTYDFSDMDGKTYAKAAAWLIKQGIRQEDKDSKVWISWKQLPKDKFEPYRVK